MIQSEALEWALDVVHIRVLVGGDSQKVRPVA